MNTERLEWEGMPDEWREWAARSLERARLVRDEREAPVRARRVSEGKWNLPDPDSKDGAA